jgi:hypothetical protein
LSRPLFSNPPQSKYDGVSKSSLTKSIMKHERIFVTGHCCPLRSNILPSLCNKPTVSPTVQSTAATDFLQAHVRQSATVAEVQGHSGNNVLAATVSFAETKGPNRASREGGGPQPCLYWPKISALTKQYAAGHYQGTLTSPGPAIVPDVFSGLAPSDVAEPPLIILDTW